MREPVEELFPRYAWPTIRALKFVVGGLARGLYRIRVEGLEHVPEPGSAAIVAANHVSLFDAPLITIVLRRRVTFLAKAEYWETRWKRFWLGTIAGEIPVQRGTQAASAALDEGQRVLELGGLLGIHPEGTRSPDGRLYRAKTGVARLAAASGTPVIPVGVLGTRDVLPKGKVMPRFGRTITFRFAEPMWFPTGADHHDPATLHAFADDLMARIAALTGQERCDEYNDASSRPRKTTGDARSAAPSGKEKTRRGRQDGS